MEHTNNNQSTQVVITKTNDNSSVCESTQKSLQPLQIRAIELRERFGDIKGLLAQYSVDRVAAYAKYPDKCVSPGMAPSLLEAAMAFGGGAPLQWLQLHLIHLSEYAGCKHKITAYQLKCLAEDINQDYWYLKLTELSWFFSLARRGKLGELGWNTFDPVRINQMLQEFVTSYRNPLISKLKDEELQKSRKEHDKGAIPMPEHIREKIDRLWKKFEHLIVLF